MLRGATRGVFLSARQIRRAANAKSARRSVHSRNVETLVHEESIFGKQKHSRFGRAEMEMVRTFAFGIAGAAAMGTCSLCVLVQIPKVLTVGTVNMMNPSVIDALNLTLDALTAEDDDGR